MITTHYQTAADIAARALGKPAPDANIAALDFKTFCARYLVIQDKRGELVPLLLNAVQRDLIDHLTGRDLVLKARQKGVSTVIQAWFYYQIIQGNVRTSTLCHEDDLTTDLREMADRYHDNMPDGIRPARKFANARVTTYPGKESRARIATVGGHAGQNSSSKRKGRGGTNTHIHGTEVAFWPDADSVMSAAMQAGNPQIILESTPNGMTGWFYQRCMEALDGRGEWTLHFYPWFVDDEYQLPLEPGETLAYSPDEMAVVEKYGLTPEQIKWRRVKQGELPHTFQQEYPEDPKSCFLASGVSYFRDVEHVFYAPANIPPVAGHRYGGGLDFAQTTDYTVLTIMDLDTLQQVDQLRLNNLSWSEMRERIAQKARKWNNAVIVGESNSMGSTNIEELRKMGVSLIEFVTTAQSKAGLIQGLYYALHEAGLSLLDDADTRHELRAFISKQLPSGAWQYEASGGAHDDIVMALALMWHGATHPQQLQREPAPEFIRDYRG